MRRETIIRNFRKWIDEEAWFVQALRAKFIGYWNFNCFAYSEPIGLCATIQEYLNCFKNWTVIDRYNEILLLSRNDFMKEGE